MIDLRSGIYGAGVKESNSLGRHSLRLLTSHPCKVFIELLVLILTLSKQSSGLNSVFIIFLLRDRMHKVANKYYFSA